LQKQIFFLKIDKEDEERIKIDVPILKKDDVE
jgi:hypothetical protein